eukprot:GABV01008826.1.p1 GENE.GABV01008826.1~~GABV01008826.1.p1  ORF type:complete len:307 (+),score=73.14 GABV01008826.1:122-922(+)
MAAGGGGGASPRQPPPPPRQQQMALAAARAHAPSHSSLYDDVARRESSYDWNGPNEGISGTVRGAPSAGGDAAAVNEWGVQIEGAPMGSSGVYPPTPPPHARPQPPPLQNGMGSGRMSPPPLPPSQFANGSGQYSPSASSLQSSRSPAPGRRLASPQPPEPDSTEDAWMAAGVISAVMGELSAEEKDPKVYSSLVALRSALVAAENSRQGVILQMLQRAYRRLYPTGGSSAAAGGRLSVAWRGFRPAIFRAWHGLDENSNGRDGRS